MEQIVCFKITRTVTLTSTDNRFYHIYLQLLMSSIHRKETFLKGMSVLIILRVHRLRQQSVYCRQNNVACVYHLFNSSSSLFSCFFSIFLISTPLALRSASGSSKNPLGIKEFAAASATKCSTK